MIHELKTDPKVFEDIISNGKNFELRKNDRNFQVGDLLILKETKYSGREMARYHNGAYPGHMIDGKPLEYTDRIVRATITYILNGPIYGLDKGWAILSIRI